MCEAIISVCGEHDNIRIITIIRCQQALRACRQGAIEPYLVNEMQPLRQQQGCNDVPRIQTNVSIITECPPSVAGGTAPCFLEGENSHGLDGRR
jgi:hypothetical protein